MVDWLKKYRAPGHPIPDPPPIPDGAIMIKEMYNSTPAAACRVPKLLKLKPVDQGAAVMIRDSKAAKDGWFWGWYGWPNQSKRGLVRSTTRRRLWPAVHGLRPVLPQLPRLRPRQPDIRQP